ncbi:porin [Nitratireductor mangrovi]|uniref:porin n=1 Tax=Nitratireductor mangrovi TaxID=2599600 RepID=UPI0019812FD6|nr:porin [Nitratireductor mangrovi]
MSKTVSRVSATALFLAALPVAAWSDEEAVDYVRVCDAFGTGFYYIPGTETCLRIGGRIRAEFVDNPSELGLGVQRTQVGANIRETYLFAMPSRIERIGGGAEFEYGLGKKDSPLGEYYGFIYGSFDYSGGNESASGTAEVGQNDVTAVGFNFGRNHPMYGNGVIATAPGFGLYGQGHLENRWGIGELGYGKSFLLGDDEVRAPYVVVRGGVFAEGFDFESRGKSKLTFNGVDFSGFYQRYKVTAEDYYAGVTTGLDFVFYPTDCLRLTIGGKINWAYHWGEANFRQVTGIGGGNRVREKLHYDNSGFTVGGALKAEAAIDVGKGWTVSGGYEFSVLPDVTGIDMRETPNDTDLHGTSDTINRHFGFLKVTRGF